VYICSTTLKQESGQLQLYWLTYGVVISQGSLTIVIVIQSHP